MRQALVCGGGFIGSHLVRRLKQEGWWVRSVDLKRPEFSESAADHFVIGDLRDPEVCRQTTYWWIAAQVSAKKAADRSVLNHAVKA